MIHQDCVIGIDIGKAVHEAWVAPQGKRLKGRTDALDAFVTAIVDLAPRAVVLEATGGYERPLAYALHAAGLAVYVMAPARVRAFARAQGQLGKTDALDAALIARAFLACQARLHPYSPSPERDALSELAAHRRRICDERSESVWKRAKARLRHQPAPPPGHPQRILKWVAGRGSGLVPPRNSLFREFPNRRSGLTSQLDTVAEPVVRRMIRARLATIARAILVIERDLRRRIAENPGFADTHRRLTAVKGVGPILAASLIADMPELGRINGKAAAALIGVAPHARQSGKTQRPGRCQGGRKHLRDILYMAALSAIKTRTGQIADFYARLRTNGKPFKLAIVAAMRKLITILNATLAIAKSSTVA